jgi:GDP-L-fucose synthase
LELQDASVVVTGGTGFLGRHLVEELAGSGARAEPVGSNDFDLRARVQIDRLLDQTRPDAVVHLAATVGGIGANRANPGQFFYENALMGIELIEACRVHAVAKLVIAATVCAYPKLTPIPFTETNLWEGYPEETNAPYGLAKKMLLVQAQAYREQYGMNAVTLLPVNLYGPGDNFDLESSHVIPAMIRKFVEAREGGDAEVVLWGDGSPTREFLHVADAARAFRLALTHYEGAEPVNVGSGQEIAIRDLAELIREVAGYEGGVVWDTSKPNGQPRRRLDTSRAREMFGFEAAVQLEDGIEDTVRWFIAERSGDRQPAGR